MYPPKAYIPFYYNFLNSPAHLLKADTLKNKALLSKNQKIVYTKKELSYVFFKKALYDRKTPVNEDENHVPHYLSLIKDPLWRFICAEIAEMMDVSAVLKIWDSKLGPYYSGNTTMDLYCPTEETAQFINQYSFLILGSLQRYFPAIKTLKTAIKICES